MTGDEQALLTVVEAFLNEGLNEVTICELCGRRMFDLVNNGHTLFGLVLTSHRTGLHYRLAYPERFLGIAELYDVPRATINAVEIAWARKNLGTI